MEEFTVYVKNKPGQLARVCDVLYRNGVNIQGVATEGTREDGTIKIITNDAATTRRALEQVKVPFDVKETFLVKIINRPGELSKITKKMGDNDINIISIYLIGDEKFALRVDDAEKAKKILKEDLL
jgi:hypothetical protein